jgi:hypothetical protein
MNRKNNMILNNEVIHSTAVKILDEIQPTVQQLLSYRANLLSGLAGDLLAANAIDAAAGRLLRDELRDIAKDIRKLEPEEGSLEWLLAETDRWAPSRAC